MLEFLDDILKLMSLGLEELTAFLDDIFRKMADWLMKNKKVVEDLAAKAKKLFAKESKTEELFRKIEKKFNLAGEEILTFRDIKRLRLYLNEIFKVSLKTVDTDFALKAKFKDWVARGVAASFDPITGIMYIRKSVTAYTVQHEMFHMKLWYRMTKEFPELTELYKKTIGNTLFHEEFVLAEFMKNPAKWKEIDLLNDLQNVNKLRAQRGLDEVTIEYYKNWKSEEELLKIAK